MESFVVNLSKPIEKRLGVFIIITQEFEYNIIFYIE
jgi:hypothetical protein